MGKWGGLALKWRPYDMVLYMIKWLLIGGAAGALAGSASALFLTSLDAATEARMDRPWLLFLLPVGGAAVSWIYWKYGKSSAKGNNLILEQIHAGSEAVPLRMAPLVLGGTLVTHLFGGSAGREGTAVQMGASMADALGRRIRIGSDDRKILLMCGISAGFGSVFGTPLAGAVFGFEVIAIGLIRYEALFPCFIASFAGHAATTAWGAQHAHYSMGQVPPIAAAVLLKVFAAAVVFGLASLCFSELTHGLKRLYARLLPQPAVRSFAGGLVIVALVYIVGSRDYLGLGLPLLAQSFEQPVAPFAFLWKLIFTSLTLGAGFQGGEVTPLFVIGATLGNALGDLLQLHGPFLAGLGLIAVFCGATNTPIACFLLGLELFGSEAAVYMFLACVVSYMCSGHSGIYTSQRPGVAKGAAARGLPGKEDAPAVNNKKEER